MRFRWFITKKMLVGLIGLLVAALFYLALTSCIPVTIRPQFDDTGKPIAIPVTPIGSITPSGELVPIYPVSAQPPTATNWGMIGTVAGGILSAFLAVYGINLRAGFGKAMTAIRLTSELADANAEAETDKDVELNKRAAFALQTKAGVHGLIQKARKK